MFDYNTRIPMDEEYEEELDTIRGKLENNRNWLADNENCHSSECDKERAYHEDRISSLEHRLEELKEEKVLEDDDHD